ncbi:unknown [[Mannheimia] succiniciproducens MBEL55E]|uniref:Uncharacterized protein n=1 Tax=Mannheimia succiniciproducens (strain KCTC 0769BP / MBEL55E) TaxID=221988 RepID=Q65UC5_MANSM|nr:unknown [[Mannheimia] succiniciproducens MBEL55E]
MHWFYKKGGITPTPQAIKSLKIYAKLTALLINRVPL